VYRETLRSITLLTEPERRASALVYMIDRGHVQYAGRLDLATQLHLVRQGHGQSGPNRDYVLSTVGALEELGLYDRELHLLAEKLRGTHEAHA
jgi:cation transport protein ChaC